MNKESKEFKEFIAKRIAKGLETRRKNREAKIAAENERKAQRVAAKTKFITDFLSSDSSSQQMKLEELFDTLEELTEKHQEIVDRFERYREDHPDTTYEYDS